MPTLQQVFGVRPEPVLSYVDRASVDDPFKAALAGDQHIVVYGSSKQGKTSLRQTYIPDNECVIVRCSPRHDQEQIYSSVLRQANVRLETENTQTSEVNGKLVSKFSVKAWIPFLGDGGVDAGTEVGGAQGTSVVREFIAFDLADAQAVSELLVQAKFQKYVVLENFHYLQPAVQRALAFDLKTFHETRVRFVVLGIWRESNHLTTNNADLEGRVVEVPVEPWQDADFDRIVNRGCDELNISMDGAVVRIFEQNAFGNVGLFQEFLEIFCRLCGVAERQDPERCLDHRGIAEGAMREKLASTQGQLLRSLQGIAAKSRVRMDESSDPLFLPYYLTQLILTTPLHQLQEGLERSRILEGLRRVHHRTDKDTIRQSDLTNLLQGLPRLQEEINPPLLYYDANTRRLKLVDTRQFFTLSRIDGSAMAEEIPYPSGSE